MVTISEADFEKTASETGKSKPSASPKTKPSAKPKALPKVEPLIKPASKTVVRKLRFFSSLRTKFSLTCFAVVAVLLLLMNTYFLMASRDIIYSLKKSFVVSQASLIAARLEEAFTALSPEDEKRVADIVSQLEVTGETHIIIADAAGSIIYDPGRASLRGNFPVQYISTALESKDVFYSEFLNGTFSSYAFTPVKSQGQIIGVVCFSEDDANQGALLLEMQSAIMNISIVVSLFSLAIITLIILSLMRRMNSIINAVKTVREGEYSYAIGMSGSDELAILSDEFNSLTARLKETDEVRRRFVADASHELKTPLATIRLLTDSILQNQDIEQSTVLEFISDINMEAERLARTTDKLMTLTKLDSQISDEYICINMKDSVTETVRMLDSLAESKDVHIRMQLSDGCYVKATEDSLHHIIFNLIENAIKYNNPGGSVSLALNTESDKAVLTVKDRGVGVPKEDLHHIFDRFYRVDKSRAHDGTATGSGLGLAIVRDTVRDLGGNVTAEIRKGGGMIFTVEFALCEPPKI